jgi:hypothetical protein
MDRQEQSKGPRDRPTVLKGPSAIEDKVRKQPEQVAARVCGRVRDTENTFRKKNNCQGKKRIAGANEQEAGSGT